MTTDTRALPEIGKPVHRTATITKAEGDDAQARRVKFVASDESVDRYGDVIRVDGWDLTHYRANPVLLFGHDASRVPIGTVPAVEIVGTRLIATAQFRAEGKSAFADDVFNAVQEGLLSAVSVGFLPTAEPKIIRDADDRFAGFEFVGQELLELSVVPVPANPQALALARDIGLSAESQRRLFVSDERAAARIVAERRRRSITLARLRPGQFGGLAP